MGALAGGAAGLYGGNKMGRHGILGTIAGAIVGSTLEDFAKVESPREAKETRTSNNM
jgi:hypothetical protein